MTRYGTALAEDDFADIPEEASIMAAVQRVVDAGELGCWRQMVGERQEARAAYLAVEMAVKSGATPEQILDLLNQRALARATEELAIRRLFAPSRASKARKGKANA